MTHDVGKAGSPRSTAESPGCELSDFLRSERLPFAQFSELKTRAAALVRLGRRLDRDRAGEHRAGTPHVDASAPENLQVVAPVRNTSEQQAAGTMETADGRLRIAMRATMGQGPVVGVEFVLKNTSAESLSDVRLAAYANLEAAHHHDINYSFLDTRTAGLLVVDPPTKVCVAMAGLARPATGHSGTWCSLPQLQAAAGVPWPQWKPFSGLPPEIIDRFQDDILAQQGIYLPYQHKDPTTPETRTLTPDQAAAVLERDWLFQAMGEPLAERAWKEIAWGRQLAARLAGNPRTPDLSRELAELAELEKRLQASQGKLPDAAAKDLYLAVRQVKRRMLFRNPLVDFSQLLFIDQP